jgi:hypothetical protein
MRLSAKTLICRRSFVFIELSPIPRYYDRMKPVRIVEDIVLRKAVSEPSASKAASGDIKNIARAVSKPFGVKIPFFIWFAVLLAESVFAMRIVTEIIPRSSTPLVSDAGMLSGAVTGAPQETAIARDTVASLYSVPTSSATAANTLPEIEPGLLPVIPVPPFKTTSTVATSSKKTAIPPSKPKPTPSQPKPVPTPTAITAKSLIDATTFSMSERYDGSYKMTFVTDAGTYGKITWDLSKTALTIGGSTPVFSTSFSCDPPPNTPIFDALDQNPTFNVKTSYSCAINLTPTSGSDRQTQSKQISFTTGAGQLVVTLPSYINTVLKDDANFGGFVFRNDDTEPVTITGLDIDVSYRGLNVADSPLVLQFKDPGTELSINDYHLENLAADQSVSYAHAGTNIHIPLSLTVGATNQKVLPVNLLGVHKLGIYGVDPTVVVTLREVSTSQNLNRVVLNSAKLSWSCIVALGAYDPNATSGPYATGQACRQ